MGIAEYKANNQKSAVGYPKAGIVVALVPPTNAPRLSYFPFDTPLPVVNHVVFSEPEGNFFEPLLEP